MCHYAVTICCYFAERFAYSISQWSKGDYFAANNKVRAEQAAWCYSHTCNDANRSWPVGRTGYSQAQELGMT
jgi:hypothetical protein